MAATILDERRPKVAHVTTVHSPFDTRIFHKQCRSLAAAGYDVTLIQRGEAEETVDGVRVVPLPTYKSRLRRMLGGVWLAVRLARHSGAEIVHFHDAELIWGALLLKLGGRKIVYDVHEDVAKDIDDKAYLPRWSRGVLKLGVGLAEKLAVVSFDRMSAATSAIAARFPPPSVTLVRNTPILGELADKNEIPFKDRPPRVVYLGGLAQFNGAAQMVAAMAELPADCPIRLTLGGRFPDAVEEQRARSAPGWDRVDYVGWVDRAGVAHHFSQARAGLVVYQPTPNIMECEPNKFFELLSAGLPLIASNIPIWRRFIEEYRCGLIVDPSDPTAIAAAIRYLVEHPDEAQAMGARGKAAILSDYNWSIDTRTLLEMYEGLLRDGGGRSQAARR